MTQFRQIAREAARKVAMSAALATAAIASASAASAQTTIITREPVQTQTIVTQEPLVLTPVQRQTIYRSIVREQVRPAEATIEYRVGTAVPDGVELYALPNTVVTEVPAIRQYKYMMVNNRVVLVDPATSQVVAEVDR